MKSTDDKVCPLGALCEIAKDAGIVKETISDNGPGYNDSTNVPPLEVFRWIQLPTYEYMAYGNPQRMNVRFSDVIYMNDDKRLTFHQIADWIEENL